MDPNPHPEPDPNPNPGPPPAPGRRGDLVANINLLADEMLALAEAAGYSLRAIIDLYEGPVQTIEAVTPPGRVAPPGRRAE